MQLKEKIHTAVNQMNMSELILTQVATFAPAGLTNPARRFGFVNPNRAGGGYIFNRWQLGLFYCISAGRLE